VLVAKEGGNLTLRRVPTERNSNSAEKLLYFPTPANVNPIVMCLIPAASLLRTIASGRK
jgi:hypothetical protein